MLTVIHGIDHHVKRTKVHLRAVNPKEFDLHVDIPNDIVPSVLLKQGQFIEVDIVFKDTGKGLEPKIPTPEEEEAVNRQIDETRRNSG